MEKKQKTSFWLNLAIQVLTAILAAFGGTTLVMAAMWLAPAGIWEIADGENEKRRGENVNSSRRFSLVLSPNYVNSRRFLLC